jgi:hypothetical protein
MTYEEALAKVTAEGAIRAYRLSDSMGYAYRLKDGQVQARGLHAVNDVWHLGDSLVSAKMVGRSADGWYPVVGLPKRAQPIELDAAKANPGFTAEASRQCYTCKQYKKESLFERPGNQDAALRNWECNDCYYRRKRELAGFHKTGTGRSGDSLDRETLASPPPPQGKI